MGQRLRKKHVIPFTAVKGTQNHLENCCKTFPELENLVTALRALLQTLQDPMLSKMLDKASVPYQVKTSSSGLKSS